MANTIQKGILQEGFELGEAHGIEIGELKGRVNIIMDILRDRFGQVPSHIVDSLNQRTDVIALKSLTVHAAACSLLTNFTEDL
ncbi:MAG: hypothetical protein LBC20_04355 [Planctomycetaceae bacterium]|jgi:hypothetical protein|nr:hypothetical protein [Planctomycetaceae bacterium]